MKKSLLFFPVIILAVIAASCAPTPAPIPTIEDIFAPTFTALAMTIQAQSSTQTAQAAGILPISTLQPTTTYEPSITPVPATTGCVDMAQFIADVNVSRGTVIKAGEPFTKTWRIKNNGTCTWNERYMLVFASMGSTLNAQSSLPVILPGTIVPPGSMIDISVPFQAPGMAGTYQSYWNLLDDSARVVKIDYGYETTVLFVEIIVEDEGAGSAQGAVDSPPPLLSVQFSTPQLIQGTWCGPDAAYLINVSLNSSGPAAGIIDFASQVTGLSDENGVLEAVNSAYEFTEAGTNTYTFMLWGPYTDPANIMLYAMINGQIYTSLIIPCQ